MQKNVTVFKVFISCPSDVEKEKGIVEEVCESLSKRLIKKNIIVKPIHWRRDIIPQITGSGAQKVINNQIEEDDYDIYIGIIWKKFGDPLENGLTPTEGEFEDALQKFKRNNRPFIAVYFKNRKFTPSTRYEIDQQDAVHKFSIRLKPLGLYKLFKDKHDFQKTIRETIEYYISKLLDIEKEEISLNREKYEKVKNYLNRKVCLGNKYRKNSMFFTLDQDKYDLVDLLEKENRIVLVGDAGVGKTVELQKIASHFSQDKSKYIPYLIKLNQFVDQKIESFLSKEWETVPEYNLLLILDGLDEIESKNKRDAIRKIELFSEQHPASKIVVSSRSNFYQFGTNVSPGTLNNFQAYILLPIEYSQIVEYINENLRSPSDDFLDKIHSLGLNDLLYIPFYLIELVKLYNSKNILPKSRSDLFDELISLRLESDKTHYRTTIDLYNKRNIILSMLQKISLCAETLGRNNITNEEMERIIPDAYTLDLLKYCSLINKFGSEKIIWQFEHNNIQEYLAAKLLSKQSFDVVKSFISFAPDYNKIIPSWLNTLSFLFSLFEEKDLIHWILINEPEITIKFEPDKINSTIRIKIFKRIFEDYKEKRIWINRDKFNYDEIARFGQQDDEIIKYLIDELESATHYTVIGSAINILARMTIPRIYKTRLKDVLIKVALNDFTVKITETVQQDALVALSDLKYHSKDIVEKIVTVLKESENDWVRYGLYFFLHNSKYLDEYIDVFLKGIRHARFDLHGSHSRLMNERYELIQGLKKISTKESIVKMFEYFMDNNQDIHDLFTGDHDITFIADNTAKIYKNNRDIFDISLKFLLKLIEGFHNEEAKQFITFFEKTDTKYLAFQKILSLETYYKEELLSNLVTPQCVDYVLKKYEINEFPEEGVWRLLHILRNGNKAIFDLFYETFNKKYDDKFKLPPLPDWEKIKKEERQKEFDLLFDKNRIIDEIKLIFEMEKKQTFNNDELSKLKTDYFPEEPYSNLAIRAIRYLSRGKDVTFNDVVDEINKSDWKWFIISNIYEKLSSNFEIQVSDIQKEWIQTCCLSYEKIINFKTAITKTGDNSLSIRWNAIYLWFFYIKFEFGYSKATLLDMLSFDYQRKGIEHLEKALSKKDLSERIIDNLQEGIEISDVLKNHLEYCSRNNIKEALPFAFIQIKNEKADNEIRRISLEFILNVNNDLKELENVLYEINDDFKWEIIEKLIDISESIYGHLRTMFKKSSAVDKIKFCNYLIKFQDIDALAYSVEWIKEQYRFDKQMYAASYLSKLTTKKAIPYLIELLKISYQKEFQQPDQFDRLDQLVLQAFKSIGLESLENYQAVKQSLEKFITSNIKTDKNVNWLYSFLIQLEQQYYVNLAQNITMRDVLKKLDLIIV